MTGPGGCRSPQPSDDVTPRCPTRTRPASAAAQSRARARALPGEAGLHVAAGRGSLRHARRPGRFSLRSPAQRRRGASRECGSGWPRAPGAGGLRTTTPGGPRGGPRSPSGGRSGSVRRWARTLRSGGAPWLAGAEPLGDRGAASAHSQAARSPCRLAETLSAPQAPGVPAPSGRDANFRASGGVDAGTEAATRVWLRPGPGGLQTKGDRTPGDGVRLGVGARPCPVEPSGVPTRPSGRRWCAGHSAGP